MEFRKEKGNGRWFDRAFCLEIVNGFLHWYWISLGITNWSDYILRKASRSACYSYHSSFLQRLLLLLVFGSRPSDQTEGTFVGIGDATNMAVIPQGLNEYIWKCSIDWFDLSFFSFFYIKSSHIMVIPFTSWRFSTFDPTSKFLIRLFKVTAHD